jgi:hypothetical protein
MFGAWDLEVTLTAIHGALVAIELNNVQIGRIFAGDSGVQWLEQVLRVVLVS